MTIRERRYKLGMSQAELAKACMVSSHALRKWERGLEEPSDQAYTTLSEVLKCCEQTLRNSQNSLAQSSTPGEGYTTAKSDEEFILPRRLSPDQSSIHVLDLFCGAGGLSYGFDQHPLFQVTCGIDLLADRVRTFHKNHPYASAIKGDLRNFGLNELKRHSVNPQIIVGGPPCQGFSSLRPFRKLTEGDKRNSLPEQYLITVGVLRPKWFVFENVVGMLTHKKGSVLKELIAGLKSIGYSVDCRVVNAANFGVPQNRERVVIVGNNEGKDFKWMKPSHHVDYKGMAGSTIQRLDPEPLFDGDLAPAVTVMEAIGDLPAIESGQKVDRYGSRKKITDYQRMIRNGAKSLYLHEATNHSEKMMTIIRAAGKNRNALPEGLTTSGFSSCYSRLDADKPSTTITVNFVHPSSNRCIHPEQDRALTPREGARLQGFPDTYEFEGTRAQIVKQIGNAVPPILGHAIASAIADQIQTKR